MIDREKENQVVVGGEEGGPTEVFMSMGCVKIFEALKIICENGRCKQLA